MGEKTASSPSKSPLKIAKVLPRDENGQEICTGSSAATLISALAIPSLRLPEEENQIQPSEPVSQLHSYPLDPHGFSQMPQFIPPVGFESHQFFGGHPQAGFNPSTEEERMRLEMAEEQFKRENTDYVVNRLAEFDINMAIEIKNNTRMKNMYMDIYAAAKSCSYTDAAAMIYANIYVKSVCTNRSRGFASQEASLSGQVEAYNYVKKCFEDMGKNWLVNGAADPGLHLTATPAVSEPKFQGLIVPSSSILKWNHQLPELPASMSYQTTYNSPLQNHERIHQNILPKKEHPQIKCEAEEMAILEEVKPPSIYTLPRDDAMFGSWPFECEPELYGYVNDPEEEHELFAMFEPHMIFNEFNRMEKMKQVQATVKLEPKSEYSPSSSKSHHPFSFEEPSVKTEPGEWKTENCNLAQCLPVQCDIVKPKMMKLFDGTVILNGQPQLIKKRLSSDKQSFQRLPAYLPTVTRTEIAVGERMEENNQESPYNPKPYWNTDAAF